MIVVIAAIVGLVCLVTALLDMGMNGAQYAGWAPWGVGISLACFLLIQVLQ